MTQSGCYLIHFDTPYTSPNGAKTIGHYLGWATDVDRRIRAHKAGRGARLMAVLRAAGIPWHVARVFPGTTRGDERRMKNRHHHKRLCPVCHPQPAEPQGGSATC